jgi:beta-lactamase superfamily II metal-dependent hydrolase
MEFAPSRKNLKVVCAALVLLVGSAVLFSGSTSLAAGNLTITLIDIGQGDATLIQSPSGRSLLFDGGKNGRGTSIVIPFLQSVGVDTLDYMVASHYHEDHIGGLDEVFNAIPVREAVYDRGWSYTTFTYTSYANAVASKRQTIVPGQVIDLGEGVTVTCVALNGNGQVSSPFDNSSEENEYDVCLLVEYGGFDYFQAGDLTGGNTTSYADIETSVGPLVGDVDVYHVSHHGSESSSNPNFMQAVQAEVSVISVGSNSYGHPDQRVLDRLVQYGSFVYQTEVGDGGTLPPQDLRVVGGHIAIVTDGVNTYTVDGDLWDIDEDVISSTDIAANPALRILGNHPNPFNPATEIRFESGKPGSSSLGVYDLMGRLVYSDNFSAVEGINSIIWRGADNRGGSAPGGVYLYMIETPAGRGSGRMLMLK